MPTLTSTVAIGLSLLIAVPVLAITGGGPGCLAPPTGQTPAATTDLSDGDATASATAVGWDAQQAAVAATIVEVGRAKGVPPWGWVVAVATAIQESRLQNLPGGDRDSIGVFQQRPSQGWGTPAQLTSAQYQAGRFYEALLAVPGWQHLPLTQAAQAVQRSAYPDAYAAWTDEAARLVEQVSGQRLGAIAQTTDARSVGQIGCLDAGGSGLPADGSTELSAGFSLPPGTPAQVVTAVGWALAQRGTPYSYGGDCTAPRSGDPSRQCDCSSLTQKAFNQAGLTLPRTTYDQARAGTGVADLVSVRAGDLLFIPGSDGTPSAAPGHVGLAIGQGLLVHAPRTGDVVRLASVDAWASSITSIRRVVP